jgi:hypothetical protein
MRISEISFFKERYVLPGEAYSASKKGGAMGLALPSFYPTD